MVLINFVEIPVRLKVYADATFNVNVSVLVLPRFGTLTAKLLLPLQLVIEVVPEPVHWVEPTNKPVAIISGAVLYSLAETEPVLKEW